MKKLFLLLVALTTIFAASPTGPGTFLLKRTATGQPVDLVYFDSVWNLGTGLRRSGDTIYLDYSGVLPGTYGDATHVPQVTIDSFGRVVNVTNVTISGGGGGGTVTSVGLALPSSVFSISGSPVVGSGTLSGSFVNQAPNTAFMGPASTTGPPTFRAILPGDISFLTDSITAAKVYALSRIHDSLVVERTFDTTVARAITRDTAIKLRAQVHDTADSVRAYARARIHDTADVLRDSLARRGTESTGLWYFPAPYISIASPTTFSVAPVRGQVVATTGAPGLTRVKLVNFAGVSGVTPTSLTTAPITYLLLDSNGALVQQATVPTLADVASNIYLGTVNHPGLTTITSVSVAPDVASRPQDQINGLWKGIGYINRGVIAYPNGANLSLNISGGDFYGDGIGWVNNAKTPVTVPVGPYVQVSMRLRTRSSTTSASTIYIDPANWDNGGTLTPVGGGINSATNQRIFITPAGQVIVAYGQQVYASLAAAVAGIGSETFVVDPVTTRNLQLLGTLSVIRTATALNNTAQAIILNASKFGELSAGSAGTATTTMQGAYDNSTPPQILTDATRGALAIKRGTVSDTNAVIAVQNGAGAVTSRLNGDGSFAGTRSILTTTSDAPISISQNLAGGFTHPFQAFNSGMVAGNQYNFDFGQSASTNNAGNFGFKYVGAGSAANYVTLGLYGANDLLTITAAGVPKFSGLTASKFVKTDASKNLVSTDVAYSDLTGTVPTWNQSTTGNAATATKWATARTVSATGDASWSVSLDGSANVSAALTLASIITAGSAGSASQVPVVTWDAKGRLTAVSSATITPAAIGALSLAGGVMNSGAQIKVVADVTTSTSTNTVYNSAPLLVSRASSSGSAVAAIGFVNPGLNGAALYYSTSSDFRYNRHDGSIATIWDNSNLTNLSQLTNGPGYITSAGSISGNAATATEAVNSTNLGGKNWDYFVQGNGAGPYGHRTAEAASFNTLLPSGFYDNRNGISPLTTGWTHMIRSAHSDPSSGSATWSFDIAANFYTSANGHQEGYYVRVNEGSSWGTWRTLWHSGNLTPAAIGAASASSLANYLPLASGSVHAPSSYTPSGPTLGIGDAQYGLSAYGGNLYLWSAPGGQVISARNFASLGAVAATTSLAWGGGILREYVGDANYTAMYGSGVGAAGNNYTLAFTKNGQVTWLGGTVSSGFVAAGRIIAEATSAGLAVTGALTATTTINALKIQDQVYGPGNNSSKTAIYGLNVSPTSSNYSLLVRKDGTYAYLNGTTQCGLSVNNADKLVASSSGITINNFAGGGRRTVTSDPNGLLQVAVSTVSGSESSRILYDDSNVYQVATTVGMTYTLPAPYDGGHFVFLLRFGGNNYINVSAYGGSNVIICHGSIQSSFTLYTGLSQVYHCFSDGVYWYIDNGNPL